jgi:hypothetical protein
MLSKGHVKVKPVLLLLAFSSQTFGNVNESFKTSERLHALLGG